VSVLVLESESTAVKLAPLNLPLLVRSHVVLASPHIQVSVRISALVTQHIDTIVSPLVDNVPVTVHLEHVISGTLVGDLAVVELHVISHTAVGGACHVHTQSGVLGQEPSPESRGWVSTILVAFVNSTGLLSSTLVAPRLMQTRVRCVLADIAAGSRPVVTSLSVFRGGNCSHVGLTLLQVALYIISTFRYITVLPPSAGICCVTPRSSGGIGWVSAVVVVPYTSTTRRIGTVFVGVALTTRAAERDGTSIARAASRSVVLLPGVLAAVVTV